MIGSEVGNTTKPLNHVAIIMDGNTRWAAAQGEPAIFGHREGVESVRAVVKVAARKGLKALSLFAFSSENWLRTENEVNGLMALFKDVLVNELSELHENNIRLNVIGKRHKLSLELQELISTAEHDCQYNTGMVLNVALDYGGRWDICQAASALVATYQESDIKTPVITEEEFASYLSLAQKSLLNLSEGNPAAQDVNYADIDLCIRTSGEHRLSNFLLWHLAYAELHFSAVYWPEFREKHMLGALKEYGSRDRRFGSSSTSEVN